MFFLKPNHLIYLYSSELSQYNIGNLQPYVVNFVYHNIAINGKRDDL